MSQRSRGADLAYVARLLVAYRIPLYVGSLIAMSVPLVLTWTFDITLSPAARSTIVAISFGVILVTYLAERRVGLDHTDPTGASADAYSLRLRASMVLAVVGIAAGLYLLLRGSTGPGLLFLAGALLFFQLAYRAEEREDDAEVA